MFGISFGGTPEQAVINSEHAGFYLKVPIMDFQPIAGQTLLSFLAGYIVPKEDDFNAQKLRDVNLDVPHVNIYPGLEPCFLALGTFENTPRRLAVILEDHYNQTKGTCPGTDPDLKAIMIAVEQKPYFEYY
ncbi:MAG: hypothetical protein GY861_02375 [bacterium]|nr:hypothetical protein [bacterium]